jgi:hypothetical protein
MSYAGSHRDRTQAAVRPHKWFKAPESGALDWWAILGLNQ